MPGASLGSLAVARYIGAQVVVLVADDEGLVRQILTTYLKRRGHEVLQAKDGTDALELLRARGDIALAILDQCMPGLTGTEVVTLLRSFAPTLPVVLCSGYAEIEFSDSFTDQLQKPFTMESLEALIAKSAA